MSTPLSAAELVRQARVQRGLTQGLFAEEIRRSQGLVSKYEAGRVEPPAEVLMHCLNILGCRPTAATAALPPELDRVAREVAHVRVALDALMAAIVAASDTDASHPPDSRVEAAGQR